MKTWPWVPPFCTQQCVSVTWTRLEYVAKVSSTSWATLFLLCICKERMKMSALPLTSSNLKQKGHFFSLFKKKNIKQKFWILTEHRNEACCWKSAHIFCFQASLHLHFCFPLNCSSAVHVMLMGLPLNCYTCHANGGKQSGLEKVESQMLLLKLRSTFVCCSFGHHTCFITLEKLHWSWQN